MKKNIIFSLLIAFTLTTFSGCGEVGETTDKVIDRFSGREAVSQGKKMESKIKNINKKKNEQYKGL